MSEFQEIYEKLNKNQRLAVDTIDGPLLVVAGPGTGKTQLLSARVAHILETTDTLPQNILCLTFTDSGANNMRDRLSRFIGQAAYDVNIGTYHAFGGDIIGRYGEYFVNEQLDQPIDTLKKHQIVSAIIENLSYRDALKQTRYHIKDLTSTISEMKRALLTPDDMRAIARENQSFIDNVNPLVSNIFDGIGILRTYKTAEPIYQSILSAINELEPVQPVHPTLGSLATAARLSLEIALIDAETINKSTPLTTWKNKWLIKNGDNRMILNTRLQNERLLSLATVFEDYETALKAAGFYDFDDMILKAIEVISQNDDLRYTLQEQYQYILLDEYQDTNQAQAKLVQLLTDNPVNEGRPNVMAVGDDDQAIYAFQGAQYSNMLDFFKSYRDTAIISLSENYRSHSDILETASMIAGQVSERLFHEFPGNSKELTAANKSIKESFIERRDFQSQIAEYAWVADRINQLVAEGYDPNEIAVLAPKHKTLEGFVPYLHAKHVPIRYEKRENILESPDLIAVLSMCRLALAIGHNERQADSLWPTVLSYGFYAIPISTIWQLSWKVSDTNAKKDQENTSWTRELLAHEDEQLRHIAYFFAAISQKVLTEPCERVLDYILGTLAIETHEPTQPVLTSPIRDHYLALNDKTMVDIVSNLTVLRTKLRDYQRTNDEILYLQDLISLVDAYADAGELMLNTSPYAEGDSTVQLMTVYKSKGLEFAHVFLLGMNDDQWGGSGKSNSNKLTLPANLAPTRHSGATEDERLRLLFVAITRAKHTLYLTRFGATYAGKETKRLKYLDERETPDSQHDAYVLPAHYRRVINDDSEAPALSVLEQSWLSGHLDFANMSLKDLIAPRLEAYQLSPTHLNTWCDLIYGGPRAFFVNTLLRFPQAPGIDGEFGNAIHETLEWVQHQMTNTSVLPDTAQALDYFDQRLTAKKLPEDETHRLIERGHIALKAYLAQRGRIFTPTDRAETNFRHEGVFVETAHMAGKIDRLEIDHDSKTIVVVDYKTGRSHDKFSKTDSDPKLHKYRQQLYCYKLLVEASHTFAGYTVTSGRLEFVEPDESGICHAPVLVFDDSELVRTKQLLESMWGSIMNFDFPDITSYSADIHGIKKFEQNMIDNLVK